MCLVYDIYRLYDVPQLRDRVSNCQRRFTLVSPTTAATQRRQNGSYIWLRSKASLDKVQKIKIGSEISISALPSLAIFVYTSTLKLSMKHAAHSESRCSLFLPAPSSVPYPPSFRTSSRLVDWFISYMAVIWGWISLQCQLYRRTMLYSYTKQN